MTTTERKDLAIRFLENFNLADPAVFEELVTEDFRFEMAAKFEAYPPIEGRKNFAATESERLKQTFPNGLNLKLDTVICEGEHVAVLARADTVVFNGRRYPQRYNFYLRFEGDRIAHAIEFNDSNLIREVFFT